MTKNISKAIERLPDSVKNSIGFCTELRLKDGRNAIRVRLDRVLDSNEVSVLSKNKHILGADCICNYRFAPEIKYSYFYVV